VVEERCYSISVTTWIFPFIIDSWNALSRNSAYAMPNRFDSRASKSVFLLTSMQPLISGMPNAKAAHFRTSITFQLLPEQV
jgi:hypothetical protein